MGIFKRITDIISANLGEMAENWEDPEVMLKQAVREMDASILEATQDTARTLANEKKLAKELAHNQSEANQWQSRAEKAVEAGDDESARKALARKNEHEKLAVALRDQLTAAKEASQTLRNQLEGMKAKLAEAKRGLATLSARNKAAEVRKKIYTSRTESTFSIDDSAFDKFDRMREKVEMAEAEADALAELRGLDSCSSSSTDAPRDDLEIDAQLAELKRKKQSH